MFSLQMALTIERLNTQCSHRSPESFVVVCRLNFHTYRHLHWFIDIIHIQSVTYSIDWNNSAQEYRWINSMEYVSFLISRATGINLGKWWIFATSQTTRERMKQHRFRHWIKMFAFYLLRIIFRYSTVRSPLLLQHAKHLTSTSHNFPFDVHCKYSVENKVEHYGTSIMHLVNTTAHEMPN